ncbi:MAG: TIGR00269 family protein [Candidatus Heimdallarchaeum endolithica]|uniref:TIGR00269 family protein n=1 Tax=Candidatus Heimdallarchaeum endolithica TaxID=2876572 RepID=A0A9Y1BQ88_9ARCH|nr:MAG: TIGR00269 family protein [Candidatus Heimdallarchaeum endolithica]
MKCTFCGTDEVVYVRPYDKIALCKEHFNEQFEKRVKRTINRYKMFQRKDKIAVGVSGGKDSIALLNTLVKIEKDFPESEIVAITIDEGIEGYREEGLYYAKKHTKRLNVKHYIFSFKEDFGYSLDEIIKKLGERGGKNRAYGACSYCGILRRKILNAAAKTVGANVVATGHNLEDEAETVLLNIIRGDVNRLGRQSPYPKKVHKDLIPRVKPFRLTPQAEIVMYMVINGLEYQEVACPYAVEAYRGNVRNFIFETQNSQPMLSFNIVKAQDKLIPYLTKNKEETKGKIKSCKICGDPSASEICKACSLKEQLSNL